MYTIYYIYYTIRICTEYPICIYIISVYRPSCGPIKCKNVCVFVCVVFCVVFCVCTKSKLELHDGLGEDYNRECVIDLGEKLDCYKCTMMCAVCC